MTQLVGAFTVIDSVQPAADVTVNLTDAVPIGILATLSPVTTKLGTVVTVPPVAVNLMVYCVPDERQNGEEACCRIVGFTGAALTVTVVSTKQVFVPLNTRMV